LHLSLFLISGNLSLSQSDYAVITNLPSSKTFPDYKITKSLPLNIKNFLYIICDNALSLLTYLNKYLLSKTSSGSKSFHDLSLSIFLNKGTI